MTASDYQLLALLAATDEVRSQIAAALTARDSEAQR